MNELTAYFIQASLYLMLLSFCMELSVKKSTNYKFSRRFLIIGLISSIFLPLLSLPNHLFSQQQPIVGNFIMDIIHIGQATNFPQEINYLAILYFLGLSFFSLRFLLSIIKLVQLYQKSNVKKSFRELPNSSMAFSFLKFIFIGENISDKDKTAILRHEKVHAKQFHTIDLLFSKMIGIIFWFNPFVYKIHQQLIEIHEYEADALSCEKTDYYTNLLLQQHFQFFDQSIIHPFNANHLKQRIMRLKEKTPKKANKTIILTSLLASCIIFIGKSYLQAANFNQQSNEKFIQVAASSKSIIQKDSTENKVVKPEDLDKNVEYPGGFDAFYEFLATNIKYPAEAKKAGIEGTVYIRCTIGNDGNLENIEVLRGVNEALDQAAIKAIKEMKRWEPAEKDGQNVATYVSIPVRFQLPKKDKKPQE